jgi:hypothetical protein
VKSFSGLFLILIEVSIKEIKKNSKSLTNTFMNDEIKKRTENDNQINTELA